jgi:phosphoribosylglycinamide formyltransferase 2
MKKIMILGSGELGKEFVISAQRLGCHCIAVDHYPNAPAMQVAHDFEVINMQNSLELKDVVQKHLPYIIVPEVEAIDTETLEVFEKNKIQVVPTAYATHLTMNRDAIRDLAAEKLKLRTAKYAYAENMEELQKAAHHIGYPLVIKPVMSSSGKGQSKVENESQLKKAWEYAKKGRGDRVKVIVEEFINFYGEITLLTIKQKKGKTLFCPPIGHVQEGGDYRESWQPFDLPEVHLKKAKKMAKALTDALGGSGLFGVEFFLTKKEVIFSELSPRPHDTGMVTLISQNLSEFDLHLRAILGLPIPKIECLNASASAVILAKKEGTPIRYSGIDKALEAKDTDIRIFNKPVAYPNRRMGVALALGKSIKSARKKALEAAGQVKIHFKK